MVPGGSGRSRQKCLEGTRTERAGPQEAVTAESIREPTLITEDTWHFTSRFQSAWLLPVSAEQTGLPWSQAQIWTTHTSDPRRHQTKPSACLGNLQWPQRLHCQPWAGSLCCWHLWQGWWLCLNLRRGPAPPVPCSPTFCQSCTHNALNSLWLRFICLQGAHPAAVPVVSPACAPRALLLQSVGTTCGVWLGTLPCSPVSVPRGASHVAHTTCTVTPMCHNTV